MTSNAIVRARSAPATSPATAGIAGLSGQLPEVLQLCNAIAGAGEMVPPAYRGKPGAVLIAKMWADNHGVDLFTAMQNIEPMDGRPYVAAEMRVALAVDKGFEFRTTEATREVCVVEVWRGAEHIGTITAHIEDQPRKLKYKSGAPTPWALHPDDMLFAEACRKADRRHVRTSAALLDAGQDYDDDEPADPVDVIHDSPTPPDQVVEAEIVDDEGEPDSESCITAIMSATDDLTSPPITEDDLRAAAKVPDIMRAASKLGANVGLVADVVADQDLARAVLAEVAG